MNESCTDGRVVCGIAIGCLLILTSDNSLIPIPALESKKVASDLGERQHFLPGSPFFASLNMAEKVMTNEISKSRHK